MSIIVSNPSSDRESKIKNAVNVIGRSKNALEFFEAVYTNKNYVKTIADILSVTSIKTAVRVLQVGKILTNNDIVQEVKDSTKRKAWKKIDFYTTNKSKILSLVKKSQNPLTKSKIKYQKKKNIGKKWDVFISYASQDKKIARSFVKELEKLDVKVWYDKDILKWGDSLMDSINTGLKNSIFGVVILSKTFFKKQWPMTELNALFSLKNSTGEKKILPLFYKISHADIVKQYPIFADIVGHSYDEGLEKLAKDLKKLIDEKRK